MIANRYDYAIVGGGPAGLAVAIFAALAGRSAIVIERHPAPVDKACGEGIMPPGVAWLSSMGVNIPAGFSQPFHGIRWVDDEVSVLADFVDGPGLGVRRTALSSAMQARATALGADVRHGQTGLFSDEGDHILLDTSHGRVTASWLVGADGLHSHVRQAAGFTVRTGTRKRFGMRRHFRVAPWSSHVEVHWAEGVEGYVTPVGPEHVGVAFLWSSGGGARDYGAFLKRFPEINERLGSAALDPESPARGSGPFETTSNSVVRGRVLLVGDASGYLDAITGEGLSLAFASAKALVDATAGGRPSRYASAWKTLRRRHITMTRMVLWLSERPALRRRVMRALREEPAAFRAGLALNTGAWGWGRALPALAPIIGRIAGA